LTRHVTAIRGAFKCAYDVDMVEDPVKFGKGLANSSAAQKRKVKQKAELGSGKKLFLREVPVPIPDACAPAPQAPVLRGINGGFRRSRS
jgi:hypothetical protein